MNNKLLIGIVIAFFLFLSLPLASAAVSLESTGTAAISSNAGTFSARVLIGHTFVFNTQPQNILVDRINVSYDPGGTAGSKADTCVLYNTDTNENISVVSADFATGFCSFTTNLSALGNARTNKVNFTVAITNVSGTFGTIRSNVGGQVYPYAANLTNVTNAIGGFEGTNTRIAITSINISYSNASTPSTYAQVTSYDLYTNGTIQNFSVVISSNNNTLDYQPFSNITAWWKLDDYNQSAYDSSGNSNNGNLIGWIGNPARLYGNAYISSGGVYGNRAIFDGSGDYIAPITSGAATSTYTVSFWANLATLGSIADSNNVILSDGSTYYLSYTNTGLFEVYYGGWMRSNISVSANTWNYYTIVGNGASTKLYVNGTLAGSSGASTLPATYLIGRRSDAGTIPYDLNGSLDAFYVSNNALTDEQVQRQMTLTYPLINTSMYYQFEGNFTNATATYANDSSYLVAGQINGAFSFDGVDDKLQSNYAVNQNTFTLSAWFKANDVTGQKNIMSSYRGAGGSDYICGIYVSRNSNQIRVFGGNSTAFTLDKTAGVINAGQWYLVTFTFNNGNYVIYLNDSAVGSGTASDTKTNNGCNAANMYFGLSQEWTGTDYLNGTIDDVKIYTSALSNTEISALYNAGKYRIYNYSTTNGTINLNVPSSDITQYNITQTSSENGGYYTKSYLSYVFNTSGNINSSIAQSINSFTAREKVTNALISTSCFYTPYLTNTTHYMRAASYNVTACPTGYYNQTTQYTAVALTSAAYEFTGLYDVVFNLSSRDYNGYNITNFTATVSNSTYGFSESQTTTNGRVSFNLTKGVLYTVTIRSNMGQFPYNLTYNNYNVTQSLVFNHSVLNLTLRNSLTSAVVSSFAANLNTSNGSFAGSSSTSSGQLIYYAAPGNWTFFVDATGYAYTTANATLEDGVNNVTAYAFTSESIYFTFINEQTNTIINGTSILIELIGSYASYNATTTNGTLYVDLLTPDAYTVRYSASGYTTRFGYITITNRTTQNVTLYLLASANATNVTATVYQQDGSVVEDALVKVLKYDVGSNSYIVREQVLTSFEGKASFSVQFNTEFYKFIVEYPVGSVALTTDPSYIDSTTLPLVLTGGVGGVDYVNVLGVNGVVSYNYATSNFRLDWSDTANSISQICLYAYRMTENYTGLFLNSSCSTSTSGSVLVYVNNVSGYEYFARAYATIDANNYFIDEEWADLTNQRDFGALGLVIAACLTVLISFMFLTSPRSFVLSLPVGLTITQLIGITYFSMWVPVAFWAICISVVMAMGRTR